MFWYTERAMGWMICGEQGIEETVEFALAYVADIADLHGAVKPPWAWLPQGMSIRRVFHRKLFAEDVIVSHTVPLLRRAHEPKNPLLVHSLAAISAAQP